MKNYQIAEEKIDPNSSRYPYCIVWTPIPVLSWLFPFIGHMGICTSSGVIRDFAGPYFVSVSCFSRSDHQVLSCFGSKDMIAQQFNE
uniref:Transmembrane protein 222a n=1 Tax=Pygocentrus nattereri TaxID=42514 RepID=A0AAR2JGA6_PYGNA